MEDNADNKKPIASSGTDELCKNYREMNETGRMKLMLVSKKIFDIWNTVTEDSHTEVNECINLSKR